jgi:hypothetical protein
MAVTYIGTSYFVSRDAALNYYKELGGYKEVNRKLKDGEITIGKPPRKRNEWLKVNDEGRYVKRVYIADN